MPCHYDINNNTNNAIIYIVLILATYYRRQGRRGRNSLQKKVVMELVDMNSLGLFDF